MRYQIYGKPVPYKGKPIWEIVGNLKNFGVGRLIVEDEHKDNFKEPTFYKLLKVQPLNSPMYMGENRCVKVWAEFVYRGKKLKAIEEIDEDSMKTKYHLIPKDEEEKYLKGITTDHKVTVIPKYQSWPPLYKKIWEQRMEKLTGKYTPIPPLMSIIDTSEKSFMTLSEDDQVEYPLQSDLFKTDAPVEDLLKKVVLMDIKVNPDFYTSKTEDDNVDNAENEVEGVQES